MEYREPEWGHATFSDPVTRVFDNPRAPRRARQRARRPATAGALPLLLGLGAVALVLAARRTGTAG